MEEKRELPKLRRSNPRLAVQFNSEFSVAKAHEMQVRLAKQVVREDRLPDTIRSVAGVDAAYVGETSIGVATALDYDSLALVEYQVAHVETQFPYIPTLLSFREVPPTFSAIEKMEIQPDVFLVDAHGIAHPYRLGFASHLGLIIGKPTIGVAKNILCGKAERKITEGWAPMVDRGEVVGAAVVTKRGQKPLYVSIGHKVSLEKAIEVVKRCMNTHRIPEPIFLAHEMANEEKRKHKKADRKLHCF